MGKKEPTRAIRDAHLLRTGLGATNGSASKRVLPPTRPLLA